jgi:hypothetical protein
MRTRYYLIDHAVRFAIARSPQERAAVIHSLAHFKMLAEREKAIHQAASKGNVK